MIVGHSRIGVLAAILGLNLGDTTSFTESIPLPYQHNGNRGKSGKTSSKRSNAASFKRAAKKRNNIRKHK